MTTEQIAVKFVERLVFRFTIGHRVTYSEQKLTCGLHRNYV